MALELLAVAGLAIAVFVGVTVGGSSTGVAFGPAVGSDVITMRQASALMAGFVLLGGVTVGTRVVETLGKKIVPPTAFTMEVAVGILLFTGLSILVGNLLKVSVSTSETAVGAVVGTATALGVVDWGVVGHLVIWWFVSVVVAFWAAAVVGRYAFEPLRDRLDLDSGGRKVFSRLLAVGLGCYMAFTAGASNTASAVAPLVGAGRLGMVPAVLIGGVAIGLGSFLLGHRTMETIGEGITSLPIEATLVVEAMAATIVTLLSLAGIPASIAITTTTCVIGLGWGRASRRESIESGDGGKSARRRIAALYDRRTVGRIVATWVATPTLAGGLAFVAFRLALG